MFPTMSARLFTRQIVTLLLALGIFLSGAAPSWAMPSMAANGSAPGGMSMAMPGMAMPNACTPDRGTPTKNAPCKNTDNSCAVCTACAVPVVLLQQTSPVRLILHGQEAVFPLDVNRSGIAVLPALPPPILSA
jgi:hypothetical protein